MNAILVTYYHEDVNLLTLVEIADAHDWGAGPYADTVPFAVGSNQAVISLEDLSKLKVCPKVLEKSARDSDQGHHYAYLGSCPHNRADARNHGLCCFTDDDYVIAEDGDNTPVEDFGTYMYQQTPFKSADEVFEKLLELVQQEEEVK